MNRPAAYAPQNQIDALRRSAILLSKYRATEFLRGQKVDRSRTLSGTHLRNNKDFLRIRVLNFGPGRVAAHIDISVVRVVRIVNETGVTGNGLGGWELLLCGRSARRFGFRRRTFARSRSRGGA